MAYGKCDASETVAQALQEKVFYLVAHLSLLSPPSLAPTPFSIYYFPLCNVCFGYVAFFYLLPQAWNLWQVAALLLLSQQEERHLLERNVNAALQRKVEELQRNLLQVIA